jgi:alpha-tubulin suppressor-like RCC1 family protein
MSAGVYHTLSIRSDGTLWAWGWNLFGQLGDGGGGDSYSPIQIGTDTDWILVATGVGHSVALKAGGTLWAWGYNIYGQLGDGTTTDRLSPTRICIGACDADDNDWVSVAVGGFHNLALKSNGTLWAWGSNIHGQLGDSSTTDRPSPTRICIGACDADDNDWVSLAAGGNASHSLALKSNGKLYAWGSNNYGQLGDGTAVDKLSPVPIAGNDWVEFVAGLDHNLALKSNGTLWAWGSNNYGQLGDGTTVDKLSPVPIEETDTDWGEIASGWNHSLAQKSNGELFAWGRNDAGQLGDGTTVDKLSPVQIGSDEKWQKIEGGSWHTIARKSDGSFSSWGLNNYGQLGDGTTINRGLPVTVWICVQNPTVMIPGHPPFTWNVLQEAYDASDDGERILSKDITFNKDLYIDLNKSVTMEGGYSCFNTSAPPTNYTEIQGNMTVTSGTVTIGNFIIK